MRQDAPFLLFATAAVIVFMALFIWLFAGIYSAMEHLQEMMRR